MTPRKPTKKYEGEPLRAWPSKLLLRLQRRIERDCIPSDRSVNRAIVSILAKRGAT